MVLINFLFFVSNILLLIFGFLYIRKKIEKLVVNKDIIAEIKKEINSMIVKLNETTMNNINLVEDKARSLEKLIKLADRKSGGLDEKMSDFPDIQEIKRDMMTYDPLKVIKQSNDMTEKALRQEEKKALELKLFDDELKDLPINEKVRYLLNEGYSTDDIKKKFDLSTGELELILNLEN